MMTLPAYLFILIFCYWFIIDLFTAVNVLVEAQQRKKTAVEQKFIRYSYRLFQMICLLQVVFISALPTAEIET